ncbi:MAG: hypothetical protein KZQ90_11225 [Candidatus Thiodiazotropha sp. (ex Codakia rugifera)]|nr:hypothetical protein [Candidatus Thiodiazotropha sp. (ex Codakia rugifera)]
MWVIIKGIPGEYTVRDLNKLVNRRFKPAWALMPIRGAKIARSKILKIMYTRSRNWEYHGLVYIKPPSLVHSVIGRLNATTIEGKRLQAHPYIRRFTGRDRRSQLLGEVALFPGERRRMDRRRGNLVSQIVDSTG